MDTELSGQSQNVLAALQPLHRHLPECLGVPSHSSLCHSQFLSLQGVPIASVSTFGFSPKQNAGLKTMPAGIGSKYLNFIGLSGAPGEIRTPDLLVRSQTLYPTELRALFWGNLHPD